MESLREENALLKAEVRDLMATISVAPERREEKHEGEGHKDLLKDFLEGGVCQEGGVDQS